MSQRARDRVNKACGLYLDPDICRNPNLTLAERVVLAQVRQLDGKRKTGRVAVSNAFLSEATGLSESKVAHAIPALVRKGWLKVEDSGYRVLLIDCANTSTATDPDVSSDAQNNQASAEKERGYAKAAPPSAKLAGPSEEEVDMTLIMTDKKAAEPPVSVIIEINSDTPPQQAAAPDVEKPGARLPLSDTFRIWAPQVCSLTGVRFWEKRKPDGTTEKVKLEAPVPGRAGSSNLAPLQAFATARWPGSDPAMSFRQALRAAAWTKEARDTLQQHACRFGDGTLTALTVMRIGGKGDALAFVRERCDAMPEPPAPVPDTEASDAEVDALIAVCAEVGARWMGRRWRSCWSEGARRALALPEYSIGKTEFYAFCALDKAERLPESVPFPWVVDSLTREELEAFYPRFLADRRFAWLGGTSRPGRNQSVIYPDYKPCFGVLAATASAVLLELDPEGKLPTRIRSRRCLLCAARELEFDPYLVKFVKNWKGTAGELAAAMRKLAERTPDDEPPIREASCGPGTGHVVFGSPPASWIRCPYGAAEGIYSPRYETFCKPSENKPPKGA